MHNFDPEQRNSSDCQAESFGPESIGSEDKAEDESIEPASFFGIAIYCTLLQL
jgi:hypothetical protein